MDNMALAGVQLPPNLQNISELNFMDAAKLMAAFSTGGEFPLTFVQNVEVRNPNLSDVAAINRLDWILLVDDKEITQGTNEQRVEVPPNSITNMPLSFKIDLRKVISSGASSAFLNLVLNLVKQSKQPSSIKLKVKPSFNIAGVNIAYPGYISLSQNFSAN
jgi:LEA14-like dessication related protein